MADWLHQNGHQVEVLAVEQVSAPAYQLETTHHDDYPVHRIYFNLYEDDNEFENLYDNPHIETALQQVIDGGSFDLIHIISGYLMGNRAIDTAQRAGLPVILTLTEYWFMCARLNLIQPTDKLCSGPESDLKCARCLIEDKRRYRLMAEYISIVADAFWSVAPRLSFAEAMVDKITARRETLKAALDACNMVICPSQALIDKFAEFSFNTDKYHFMRQGLEFKPDALPIPVDPAPNDGLRLGYIGQLQPHKGVDLLINAAIQLLDEGVKLSLDIWGSEEQAPQYCVDLKAKSAPYAAIRWNGRYSGGEVWDVLSGVDLLVVPSRWYENSPNVILEAYAMRRPVIATDLGGMAELVRHEQSGLVFALNDQDDLARQIRRVAQEPGLLEQLQAGIPTVKTIDQEMEELLALYSELTSA